MAKERTPSFVLTLEMQPTRSMISKIESDLEVSRVIYNSCLGELVTREKQMKRTKKYKKVKRCLSAVSKKLSYYEMKENKEKVTFYQTKKKQLVRELVDLQKQFHLSEYWMHEYMKPTRHHFDDTLNADFAQKVATRALNTIQRKLKGEAKKVTFRKRGDMFSFEGKKNSTGWFYRTKQIVFGKSKIDVKIKENDGYIQEALSAIESNLECEYTTKKGELKNAPHKVKYVRVLKHVIRGNVRYYAQLIVQGFPPAKRKKGSSFKYKMGTGRVGGDLGTSSITVVGENGVLLTNLAENVMNFSRQIQLI